MKRFTKPFSVFALATLLVLGGCGGGGGGSTVAGIGGTGRIASGTITGFGSIFVNGGEYIIDTASCEVDDNDRSGDCQANLRIGMVVSVASDDFDGTTGTATSVLYDDNVEGPVAEAPLDDGSSKRFTVLGVNVVVDAVTTVFDDSDPTFTYNTIAKDDLVEISGLFDGNGVLNATYIEKQGVLNPGTTQVELKGTVSGAGAGAGSAGDTFVINGITVTLLAGADLGDVPGGVVTDGLFVEARGTFVDATNVSANKVEVENEAFGSDEDDVSIEGYISNFVDSSSFTVAGVPVDASSATREPATLQLRDGLKVEVEGPIVAGTLVADKVEAEGGELQIDASVQSTDAMANTITLTLGSGPSLLSVSVDSKTEMENESGGNITVGDINPGDFLEVRAFDTGGGTYAATKVVRSADVDNDVILQGPLDDLDIAGSTITVLGVQFMIDGSTRYEDVNDTGLADVSEFNALVSNGDRVKVRDNDTGGAGTPNGTADEVDLEN